MKLTYLTVFLLLFLKATLIYSQVPTNNLFYSLPDGISLQNTQYSIQLDSIIKANNSNFKPIINPIDSNIFDSLLTNNFNKPTILLIWGGWCPTTISILDYYKELNKYSDELKIVIVSVDIFSQNQVNYLKKILLSKYIYITSYILFNEYANDYEGFQKLEHVYNFIKRIDRKYKKIEIHKNIEISPMPYIACFDKDGSLIYSEHPNINSKEVGQSHTNNSIESFFNPDIDKLLRKLKIENK